MGPHMYQDVLEMDKIYNLKFLLRNECKLKQRTSH